MLLEVNLIHSPKVDGAIPGHSLEFFLHVPATLGPRLQSEGAVCVGESPVAETDVGTGVRIGAHDHSI